MHAMVLNAVGAPLDWTELPEREPGPGQIRVKVSACGVCRTDLHVVDGELPHPITPIIPGHEIVGRIDRLGPGVEGLKVGERVGVPWLGHTCGVCPYCIGHRENLCDAPLFTGYTRDGGFATAVTADARFASIIGTGQRTVTGIERRGGQFHYAISAAGDGTVAAARATLPGARNYYVRCEHGELPRNELVARAVVDLLRTGRTQRLPQRVVVGSGRTAYVSDAELRRSFARKIDWHGLRTAERRRYFARLSAPPALYWPSRRG